MALEKQRQPLNGSNGKGLVGFAWSCADMKLLLTSLFFLCTLATVVQFLPAFRGVGSGNSLITVAAVDRRPCLESATTVSRSVDAPATSAPSVAANRSADSEEVGSDQHYHHLMEDEVVRGRSGSVRSAVTRRVFNPVGSAGYLFILMGAYRGGPDTFAVVGLASKPLHVYAKPGFQCQWIPHSKDSDRPPTTEDANLTVTGHKILPDWGYGRVYTVVVVNCTFPTAVGANGSGGQLLLHASTGRGADRATDEVEVIEVLTEAPRSVDFAAFSAPPKYDYLYCGSPLYGNLSPQRVREWLAYHVRLFGPSSHFVFHDAGGVHRGVMDVLRPWMEKGYVTLQDIREQERFDGYYHNQFLVVNDCLHRYRFNAKWMFFFDVDEFIYVSPRFTLASLLKNLSDVTQFTIEQMPMSSALCLKKDIGRTPKMWGLEKLVYRDVKRGIRKDRKYAIQPRNALATGVHMSQNIVGKSLHGTYRWIKYFHYHGTIANRHDPCVEFLDTHNVTYGDRPYVVDTTLRALSGAIKKFELDMIGRRLQRTRQ